MSLLTIRHVPRTRPPRIPAPTVYNDNTFVDWMKEAVLPRSSPLKKWTVLVLMAVAVGYMTVIIVLFSAGLNDFKKGVCYSDLDRWSLLSPYLTCPPEDWYSWLRLVSSRRDPGAWLVALVDLPIYVALDAMFVVVAGYVTYTRAPLAKQSGIPEIKLIVAGLNYHTASYLGTQPLLVKATGLVMIVALGIWLGKEGPLAHVACCILLALFDCTYGAAGYEGLRRELLAAATATGIAVAFNSPVGGVLFVLELIPSYFSPIKIMWNSFVAATITLVVVSGSKALTEGENYHEGRLFKVLFGNFNWLLSETAPFLVLGLAGGLYGHLYTQTYLFFGNKTTKNRLWARLASYFGIAHVRARYLELVAVALAAALATFPVTMSQMSLEAYLKLLFTECPATSAVLKSQATNFMCSASAPVTGVKLAYIFVVGFFVSSYAYGLSLPGGVLMPSLALGATLGRLLGLVSQAVQNRLGSQFVATCTAKSCLVSPSAYAVVGAAAFMTGITKCAVASVVIIFELTGALTYVLPIMVAVMTAKIFNDWLSQYNIYDAWIVNEFNTRESPQNADFNLAKGDGLCEFGSLPTNAKASLPDVSVGRAMVPINRTRQIFLYPAAPYLLGDLHAYLAEDGHEGYPVLCSDDETTCVGYVTKTAVYELFTQCVGNTLPFPRHVCFRVSVDSLAKRQQEYEDQMKRAYATVEVVQLAVEMPVFTLHSQTSLRQTVDLFEGMHLNWLIVTEYANATKACGFVDRFILARLIRTRFERLTEDPEVEPLDSGLDLFNFGRERENIELIEGGF